MAVSRVNGGEGEGRPYGFQLGYRRWLDGLRGVAILLVLAFHLGLLPGGSFGVDVFFVLSGFLITSLLLEEWQRSGSIRLKHFYARRALRLLPAFVALLVLCGLSSVWLATDAERRICWREMAVAACYLSNWPSFHAAMPRLQHTWSLAVEEQFYLLWPMLLYGMLGLKFTQRRILWCVAAGVVASAALRLGLYHRYPCGDPDRLQHLLRLYMGLDTRADALLIGCLVGLLAAWNLLPESRRFVFWMSMASCISLFALACLARRGSLATPHYYNGLFTAVALMSAAVIVRLLSAPSRLSRLVLESAPLVGMGRISYGLYLFHMPILHACWPVALKRGHYTFAVLVAGLSLLAALLSYFLIERPCLRLKDRLRPRTPGARPSASVLAQSVPAQAVA